jgi:hypothetical protein
MGGSHGGLGFHLRGERETVKGTLEFVAVIDSISIIGYTDSYGVHHVNRSASDVRFRLPRDTEPEKREKLARGLEQSLISRENSRVVKKTRETP